MDGSAGSSIGSVGGCETGASEVEVSGVAGEESTGTEVFAAVLFRLDALRVVD
ncbi:hypothetical protein H6F51_08275 [Cyanobacteria bacterium FACHB-DQ100]|uniref:hypothetical protein n=1 Tax=Leptolyngbya sp. DQ-M1 TaxID=2933920 RepID=UPI00198FE5A4|nr:hypothetical protein [Cyanobacteria bacterium FACHB-DQ100]